MREGRTRSKTHETSVFVQLNPLEMALFSERVEASLPYLFEQAWNHQNIISRRRWRNEILDELCGMVMKKVWTLMPSDTVPEGKRTLSMKWVFDIKNDNRYRARLVAMGFRQIPGVDFVEVHAPVMSEIAFRLLLLLQLKHNFNMCVIDVEKAF